MNRMTAVGLCTCVILAGCTLDDADASGASPEIAAQQTESADRTVHGAVRGEYGDKPFTALLTVSEFVERNGALRALGTLSNIAGSLGADDTRSLENAKLDFPVTMGPAVRPQVVIPGDAGVMGAPDAGLGAVCDVLYVRLAAQTVRVEARELELEEITLDVEATPSVDSEIGHLLCEVSALLDPAGTQGGPTPANVRRAVTLLNRVVALNHAMADAGAGQIPALDAGPRPPAIAFDASTPLHM